MEKSERILPQNQYAFALNAHLTSLVSRSTHIQWGQGAHSLIPTTRVATSGHFSLNFRSLVRGRIWITLIYGVYFTNSA